MAVKEFREMSRDRRMLGMLIAMPILLLVVFGYAASFDVSSVKTIVVGPQAELMAARVSAIPNSPFDVVAVRPGDTESAGEDALRRGDATVVIVADIAKPEILIDGSDLFGAKVAVAAFANIGAQAGAGSSAASLPFVLPAPRILFNPDLKTSTIMVPGLAGMILLFIAMVATSLGVVRERASGTLEQLAVMPIRPTDVFVGKILPYLVLAVIDLAIVIAAGILIFGTPFNGNPLIFALGAGLFLFVALGLGVLISTVSETQGQAMQLSIMVALPQILLSGMIFPLDSIPWGVRWISYFLPLTYYNQVARGVLVRGAPLDALVAPLVALAILSVLVFGLSVLRFRRDLTPAGSGRPNQEPKAPSAHEAGDAA
jgi:ABC-2 type transport system permease protein